jgi:hypothetical protein
MKSGPKRAERLQIILSDEKLSCLTTFAPEADAEPDTGNPRI